MRLKQLNREFGGDFHGGWLTEKGTQDRSENLVVNKSGDALSI